NRLQPLQLPLLAYTTLFRAPLVDGPGAVLEHGLAQLLRMRVVVAAHAPQIAQGARQRRLELHVAQRRAVPGGHRHARAGGRALEDRKSTRLNSSHVKNSYAV